MKKVVSIGEFQRYLDEHKPSVICFSTTNQPWRRVTDPCSICCDFTRLSANEDTNMVWLGDHGQTISFSMVRSVLIDTDTLQSAALISVLCGGPLFGLPESTYVLLAWN